MTFREIGLSDDILRAVDAEGYTHPTPIQSKAIPHLLSGRDLLGCAQTGTGKTAAFALPILHRLAQAGRPPRGRARRIRALVVTPTRELAAQIGESFRVYGRHAGLRHTVVFGGVSQQPQVRALGQGVDILVATPGRLLDLINQGYIDLGAIETFVLDEADRMLDMGFLPDVRRLIARLPSQRQTVLFSATMPQVIEGLANAILQKPARVRITPVRATTELIEQSVVFVPKQQKTQLLTRFLAGRSISRALVFTRTKRGADRVARQLNQSGIQAGVLHGAKSQSSRQRTLEQFKSNRTHVLVATDLAARGIDVEGISHVLNYDLPFEPETYVHRIGRTGRAGATGIAISFCDHDERKHLAAIEQLLRKKLGVAKALARAVLAEPGQPQCRTVPSEDGEGVEPKRRVRNKNQRAAKAGKKAKPAQAPAVGRRAQKKRLGVSLGL